MADFFTNLVARTLSATPVLEPLLSPAFGATTNVTASEPYALEEVEESISPQPSVPVPPVERMPPMQESMHYENAPAARRASEVAVENFEAHTHARIGPPVPSTPLVSPSPALSSPFLYQQEKKTRIELPPKFEDDTTSEHEASSPKQAPRALNLTTAITPPRAPQKLFEEPREELPRQVAPQRGDVHTQEYFTHTENLLVPREEKYFVATAYASAHEQDMPRSASATFSPQRREAAGALQPLVLAEREYFSNRNEEREIAPHPPSPAPIIRVNIGRIEVRAVQPSATAPATRPRKRNWPALSLEDYLRQRNGSSR